MGRNNLSPSTTDDRKRVHPFRHRDRFDWGLARPVTIGPSHLLSGSWRLYLLVGWRCLRWRISLGIWTCEEEVMMRKVCALAVIVFAAGCSPEAPPPKPPQPVPKSTPQSSAAMTNFDVLEMAGQLELNRDCLGTGQTPPKLSQAARTTP
jgi:hypothetical protein